ncbi:hypothetical protein HNY73_000924 [Argiope bruennichi]|uniref:Uncharacterized protein n=1 Tax=Argiope bruennichi TaxID=94029 RepID=A0A8T0FZP2_ARGBR|nr:hypothetical protein HNY73_000924 [Argiope bruennichi]
MGDIVTVAFCLLLALPSAYLQEHAEHREFQYNSVVDPSTGRYNFAYDTGNDNDIAHSLHMQYQDANGIVRGRYGYTDPRGKLRMVEYEAGPNGFIAKGDVGPDQFPHDQAPAPGSDSQPVLSSLTDTSANDFDLDPAPVQMAGWDPAEDPMNQAQPGADYSAQRSGVESENPTEENSDGNELTDQGQPQYATINVTSENALDIYGPELGFYNDRYPRISYSLGNDVSAGDSGNSNYQDNQQETTSNPIQENPGLNIYNIDVDPDQIREAAGSPVRRSINTTRAPIVRRSGDTVRSSYRYYPRQTHDHDAEMRSRWAHDHYNERTYRLRQTHDHDAEKYRSRQTHDHDAEKYRARQTHDHDAEKYRARQTHDHDAERYRYYRYPDHTADRAAYYRRVYGRYDYPRRIFYRDSHSMEPHEHYDNPVYQNYRDHQHSDVHLYGRYRNYDYPATAKPRQLHYVPADKYHDKAYYWTYS